MMKEKTYVEDINRSIYDFRNEDTDNFKIAAGLTPELVSQISKEKNDPAWMQNFRLQALQIYNQMECTALAADDLDVLSLPLLYTQSKQLVESAAYAWLETVARKHPTYVRTMRGSNPPAFLLERARIDAVVAKVAAKRAQAASGRRGGYAS